MFSNLEIVTFITIGSIGVIALIAIVNEAIMMLRSSI